MKNKYPIQIANRVGPVKKMPRIWGDFAMPPVFCVGKGKPFALTALKSDLKAWHHKGG
jgi:hypothetical protein